MHIPERSAGERDDHDCAHERQPEQALEKMATGSIRKMRSHILRTAGSLG